MQEGEREGRTETIRKYNIAPCLYDRWRRKYFSHGMEGLKNHHKRIDPQDRAVDFYTNKLGFKQTVRYGNEWAEIEAPQLRIALHPTRGKEMVYSHNMQLGFAVADIRERYCRA